MPFLSLNFQRQSDYAKIKCMKLPYAWFKKIAAYFSQKGQGFTIIEMMIFSAIFAVTAIGFFGILNAITSIQARQAGAGEVNTQSQFLLQTIQYYVNSSSLIELATDSATTTLKLRVASSTIDPTYIYLSGNQLLLKLSDTGVPQTLSSSKVSISNLSFVKHSNPPARDSVSVSFTVSYNTPSLKQRFSQTLNTSIARVNAATFDSNVIPASSNTYKIGASSQLWQSVNDLIYFSGSNVGIGTTGPAQALEVNGGLRLNTVTAQPACAVGVRGTFWAVQGGGGTKDNVQVCVKNASGTYLWATIY